MSDFANVLVFLCVSFKFMTFCGRREVCSSTINEFTEFWRSKWDEFIHAEDSIDNSTGVFFYLFMQEEKSNTGERLLRDIKREEVRKTKNSNTTLLILVNSFLGAFDFTVEVFLFETLRSNLFLKGPLPHLCRSF